MEIQREGFGYKIYTFLIRNRFVLYLLRVADTLSKHSILNRLDEYLKDDCKEFTDFESFIAKIRNKIRLQLFYRGTLPSKQSV